MISVRFHDKEKTFSYKCITFQDSDLTLQTMMLSSVIRGGEFLQFESPRRRLYRFSTILKT